MRRLRRLLPLLALGLTTAAQVGAAVQPQVIAQCEEACADGDESGHCPPSCACACVCHAPKQPAPAGMRLERRVVAATRMAPANEDSPASPSPKRIRHVPKASLEA